MPYIEKQERERFDPAMETLIKEITDGQSTTQGDLNYILTKICDAYVERRGKSYSAMAEVVAGLECAKLEYYRRVAAPYEDKKIIENGDVR